MLSIKKFKSVSNRFKRNEDGQMALMMAVSAVAVISVMGAAIDFSVVSNADSKAQTIADSSALTAAIHVKNNGAPPTSKSEGLLGSYTAGELGYNISDWVRNGASGVNVDVRYDNVLKEVNVIVTGETKPAFAQVMGHQTLPFKAKSIVKYSDVELKDPASIALVLDGSGSMAWDDVVDNDPTNDETESVSTVPGAKSRNESLKSAAKLFMDKLEVIENSNTNQRILRTGMYVYHSSYDSSGSQKLSWGALDTGRNSKLNKLRKSGGTNSYAALKKAREDMTNENNVHLNEHGNGSPLKYVILMTDGVNSETSKSCIDKPLGTHDHWEGWVWNNSKKESQKRVSESRFAPKYGWGWQKKTVTNDDTIKECTSQSSRDASTIAECQTLANQGTKIFTIGYGLEPGHYHMRSTRWNDQTIENAGSVKEGYHVHLPQRLTDRAYSMLQTCAEISGGEFVAAKDAAELTAAFETIGTSIVNEVIRVAG